ncbi:MAG: hypothetical protein VKL59_05425 [Nostocaceae cyanobacterium]|nr:hypothetical protein [Nostocaceae cyanobacterium]
MAEFLGVRYIYEQETPEFSLNQSPEAVSLAVMSPAWIDQLYQAAETINNQAILQLIDQIPPSHGSLAQVLTDWVNHFRCDSCATALVQIALLI